MIKWLIGILLALSLIAAGLVAFVYATAIRTASPVGLQIVQAPRAHGDPLAIAIWYPTTGRPLPTTPLGLTLLDVVRDGPITGGELPLVVISHGNGGGPGSHADTAMALAESGYVVIAPLHEGDNYLDDSAFGSSHWLPDRSREVQAALDYILTDWPGHTHIAPERIGIFGFSAGGLTALTSLGAEPDLQRVASHCADTPEFVCTLLSATHSELLSTRNPPRIAPARDPRIQAAVVAAPGLGFTLTQESLARTTAPVQLWSGDADTNVPYATNIAPVREALGAHVEYHSVPGAGHFSFLAPCGAIGPPLLCRDGEGFDRRAFHRDFNAQVVAFFEEHLSLSRAIPVETSPMQEGNP